MQKKSPNKYTIDKHQATIDVHFDGEWESEREREREASEEQRMRYGKKPECE